MDVEVTGIIFDLGLTNCVGFRCIAQHYGGGPVSPGGLYADEPKDNRPNLTRLGAIILFERLRHPSLQLLNARPVRRVIGEELWRLRGIRLFHSLPKSDAFSRVISGARHVNEPDVVRF